MLVLTPFPPAPRTSLGLPGSPRWPHPAPAWSPGGAAPGFRQHGFTERSLRARPCSGGAGAGGMGTRKELRMGLG